MIVDPAHHCKRHKKVSRKKHCSEMHVKKVYDRLHQHIITGIASSNR